MSLRKHLNNLHVKEMFGLIYAKDMTVLAKIAKPVGFLDGSVELETLHGTPAFIKLNEIWAMSVINKTKKELLEEDEMQQKLENNILPLQIIGKESVH